MDNNIKNLLLQYRTWFKIGLFTFGGGYAILPMIDKELVSKHNWVNKDEVLDYYAIGQSLPGIIAVNTAAFIGFKTSRVPGSIFSILGVITPSMILITLVATLLAGFSDMPVVRNALAGIQIAVCMLMTVTILQFAKGAFKDIGGIIICAAVFALTFFEGVNIFIIVILSALSGIVIQLTIGRKKQKEDIGK
jgi:chromate transporter